jgi:small-conductance mechanosensitive channel
MHARKSLAATGVLSFSVMMLIILSSGASAQEVVFREINSFEQECPASESIYYQWFFYNHDAMPYLVEASVDVQSGPGWKSALDRPIFVLDPGDALFVNMTVTATADVSSKTVNQTVVFDFTDLENTSNTFEVTSVTSTKFLPMWDVIAPGKNKILGHFDNPFPPPLDGNYATFFLNMLVWLGIGLVAVYVVAPALRIITKKTKTDIDDRILKILHVPLFAIIIVFGLVNSLSILQLKEGQVDLIVQFYGAAMVVVVTYIIYKIFKEILIQVGKKWSTRTKSDVDDVLVPVIDKIGGVIIIVFGTFALLTYMGYDITFLLAGVGVAGLVIAFAAQDFLSNFFSGIFLLLDRPFAEGEFIQIATGEMCRVEKIGIRSTRLYEVFQNDYIILPNNKLVNDKIVNLNEPDDEAKTNVVVGVAYGTDAGKVEKIMMDVAKAHPNVLRVPGKEPVVRFTNFGDSSLEFKLFVWVDHFMNQWVVAHDLRKSIKKRFEDEGIEIPFPQRTVHIVESKGK